MKKESNFILKKIKTKNKKKQKYSNFEFKILNPWFYTSVE